MRNFTSRHAGNNFQSNPILLNINNHPDASYSKSGLSFIRSTNNFNILNLKYLNMKTVISNFRVLPLVVMFMVLATLGYATTPVYQCYIDNDQSTSNTYQFDIKVKAVSGTISFSDFQFGIFVNPGFVSGTVSASILSYSGPGGRGAVSYDNVNNMVRLSVDTTPSLTSISTACSAAGSIGTTPVAVYRIQISTTGSFGCAAPNLEFNFGNSLSGGNITATSPWQTRIAFWASCSPVNDSDITEYGEFNSISGYANSLDSVTTYSSNLYSGASPISPNANNPVGVTYYADLDGDGYTAEYDLVSSCTGAPANYYPIYTLPTGTGPYPNTVTLTVNSATLSAT
jgi:hypothetical protein